MISEIRKGWQLEQGFKDSGRGYKPHMCKDVHPQTGSQDIREKIED